MTALLTIVLAACSENDNNDATDNKEPIEQNDTNEVGDSSETDSEWHMAVGETVVIEGAGEFTIHARNDQIDEIVTDTVTVDFDKATLASGALIDGFAEHVGADAIEYIQLDIQVLNKTKGPINFDAYQPTVITSTGEEITVPNHKLGVPREANFNGEELKQGSIFYTLESSKAEDVEWIRIIMDAPRDENDEKVGEDVEITVEFKG